MKQWLSECKPVQLTELEAEFKNMSTSEKAKPERLFRSPKRFNVAGGGAGDSTKAGGTKVANQGRSINKVAKPPSSDEADALQLAASTASAWKTHPSAAVRSGPGKNESFLFSTCNSATMIVSQTWRLLNLCLGFDCTTVT